MGRKSPLSFRCVSVVSVVIGLGCSDLEIPHQNDGCLNFVDENDEVLISGFGRRGKAKGDIPGVRFKVVKVSGVGLLALWKEKKVRISRAFFLIQLLKCLLACLSPGEAPLIIKNLCHSVDSFFAVVYVMLVLQLPKSNLCTHIEHNLFRVRDDNDRNGACMLSRHDSELDIFMRRDEYEIFSKSSAAICRGVEF